MKKFCFFLIFGFVINIFAFDVRKPEEVDYIIGYSRTPLEKQNDYQFINLCVDFSYPLKGKWDFQFEPFVSSVFQPESNFEIGLAFFFRYVFFEKKAVSFFLRGGSGVIYISQDTYEQATKFNFVDQICAGFKLNLTKAKILIEYRYRHISNAGIKRPNSGINSNIFFIGFSHHF